MEEKKETKVAEGNKLTVMIDSKFFNCHICDRPLKPPVFQCKGIHFVCGRCSSKRAEKCACLCNLTSCSSLDAILQCAVVCCPNSSFGCQEKYLYYNKSSHELDCPFDPNFFCPFGGYCPFKFATLEELTSHVKLVHKTMWCCKTQYGKKFSCTFHSGGRDCQLVTGEDGRCFLVACEHSGDGFYISLMCMGSESAAVDLCYEITSDVGYDREAVWSMTSSQMMCTRRWTGISDKCRFLFLSSEDCSKTQCGELQIKFTVCIRKK